jgi:hypothetical protein
MKVCPKMVPPPLFLLPTGWFVKVKEPPEVEVGFES